MTRNMSVLMAAGAIAIAPTVAMASAPGGGNGRNSAAPATPQSPTGNGGGYNHTNSPQHMTGQPNQSCQDINGGNTGPAYPGHTTTSPGSPFNETNGKAGGQYAGSQPQNSRNTASVSQYDVACSNQPH
jgi:hypothetical protein